MSQRYSPVSPEISGEIRRVIKQSQCGIYKDRRTNPGALHLGISQGICLLVVAGLITLAACSPAASAPAPSTAKPAVSPLAEKGSAGPAADQRTLQDKPATAEPTPETGLEPLAEAAANIPATGGLDDPKELMQSALDLALQGDSQGVYRLGLSGNVAYIPVLIDMLRLSRSFPDEETRSTLYVALSDIAQQNFPENFPEFDSGESTGWSWWVEWLGRNPEVKPPPGYAAWKGRLYARLVDPEMGDFLYAGVKTNIRLEEVVWGGVRKDGIPDLTNPPVIDADEAGYLDADERVFGVSFNGEHRAYPHRILNAHEMSNDVVGGVPFALAY